MDFNQLIQQPESLRDQQWEYDFLNQISGTMVQLIQDQPVDGPDGWPYMTVRTGGDEPFSKLVKWASSRGIGIALNTQKMVPDYIFTYGMLWNFVETGLFVVPTHNQDDHQVMVNEQSLIGPPTDSYLPPYVRKVLKAFLSAQGFTSPKILVISTPDYKNVDLVFSEESTGNLKGKDQSELAAALGWFLPSHYSLAFAGESRLNGFAPL